MANNQEKDGKKAKAQPVSKTVRPRRVVEPKMARALRAQDWRCWRGPAVADAERCR